MKKLNLSSPLGIALTVAGVILALSPEARRATRRLLVKGTAAVLGAVDQAKGRTLELVDDTAETALEAHEELFLEPATTDEHSASTQAELHH
jgi:hypothetical protein